MMNCELLEKLRMHILQKHQEEKRVGHNFLLLYHLHERSVELEPDSTIKRLSDTGINNRFHLDCNSFFSYLDTEFSLIS